MACPLNENEDASVQDSKIKRLYSLLSFHILGAADGHARYDHGKTGCLNLSCLSGAKRESCSLALPTT